MKKNHVCTDSKWFAKKTKDILVLLETNESDGLTQSEANYRIEEFGKNVLPSKKRENKFIKFFKHFHDILIYILFIAAAITFILSHYADTIVIILVAVVNATIGFFQENKAEKALEDIKKLLSLKATVIRNRKRFEIDASELTIGDIVLLNAGDKVPADLRLLQINNLRVEESALTGEAVPSEKQIEQLDDKTMLGDRTNMVFSGTTVIAGTGIGVVVAVGLETEIGHISQLINKVDTITTPLLRQMKVFGQVISLVIIGIACAVYLFGSFFRDYLPSELLLATIGLAIAAIPEGLPAILSIILAVGVQNMAKRKAIVRNLPSVETLGSVSVICSDKTGTLTKNEMTVKNIIVRDERISVTGSGYAPEGELQIDDTEVNISNMPILAEILQCFNVCNDSALVKDEAEHWQVQGDPTEGALLTLYAKSSLDKGEIRRVATIPFDSEYKYMATLIEQDNNNLILIKGAPDKLLEMATSEKSNEGISPLNITHWNESISYLANHGQRIIGAAVKVVDKTITTLSHEEIHNDIIFLGLAGIMDPPREEAIEAIAMCKQAGISVKMITGDHIDTAKAIGHEMGIGEGDNALLGKYLDDMTDEQLVVAVNTYDIFARTTPEHKLSLVKALQSDGKICAMTGDGVNDAPALKKADIGIAMGIKGTEVTKESAEIVITDDNFATIIAAVEEGRRVYDNLKKTILFILPTNGAESFLIIASILFGTLLPLTPVQILWVNMVTSITVSLALAFEKVEPGTMQRQPRSPTARLLDGYFIWRIIFVSVIIGGGTLIANVIMLNYGFDEHTVRTVTIQIIVMSQLFHLFNSRSIRRSAFESNPFSNRAVIVVSVLLIALQLFVTYIPFMNRIFGTVPLSLDLWLLPILLGFAVFLIVEGEKAFMRKRDSIISHSL